MATIASTRKKQFVLKLDSGTFPAGAFSASDAIPVEIAVDFVPDQEKYDLDIARDKDFKNETLMGGAKSKASIKTFLIGSQPPTITSWLTGFTDTLLKSCAMSGTNLTRIEVTAQNLLIKRGDAVIASTPSAYVGVLAHNKTILIGGKHYIFSKTTSGSVGNSSVITIGAQSLTAVATTPSVQWGVEYSRSFGNQPTYSAALWSDGLVQKMYGSLGNVKIEFEPSKIGMVQIEYSGIYAPDTANAGDLTAMGLPLQNLAFQAPNASPKAKGSAWFIGASTAREFRKITLDLGVKPEIRGDLTMSDGYQPAICLESEPKITIEMATSVSNMASDRALLIAGDTKQDIDGLIGTALGNSFYFFANECQLQEDTDGDGNKVLTNSHTYGIINGLTILSF